MKLDLVRILQYYDVPRLFVAEDALCVPYLCLIYKIEQDGGLKYIGIRISKSRLNDFIKGHIDLRTIYTNPEVKKDYYSVSYIEDGSLVANRYKGKNVESLFPEEGYFYNDDTSVNQEMIEQASRNNQPVIRLAFQTPNNRHDIDLCCFSAATKHFQSLVDNCYRKLYKNEDIENCQLRLTTFSAASFDVELVAKEDLDLFGQSRVGEVLEEINKLFSIEEEKVINTLRHYKGRTVDSYKKFIEVLKDNNMTIHLKWVYSTLESKVHQNKVDRLYIDKLNEIINIHSDLTIEEHTAEGVFTAADDNSGSWKFKPLNKKSLTGTCERNMLTGVIIKAQKYKINYRSEQSINQTTLKSTIKYELINFEKI